MAFDYRFLIEGFQTNDYFLKMSELQKKCYLFVSANYLKHQQHTLSFLSSFINFKWSLKSVKTSNKSYFCYRNFHSGYFLITFSIYFFTTVNFKDRLFLPVKILIISQNLKQFLSMKNKVPMKSLVFLSFKTLLN